MSDTHKNRVLIIAAVTLLVLTLVFTAIYFHRRAQWLTFNKCEKRGGTAWAVDLFHPDICPACAVYRQCESYYNDYTNECPVCYGPCQECQAHYNWLESCPQCNTTCRECENQHLHDFKDEEERFRLCPDCQVCDECREEINEKIRACQPCIECEQCKEANKKYEDIQEVCPEIFPCMDCMEEMGLYPDKCPGGMAKIGNISDAAMWFMCCKQ